MSPGDPKGREFREVAKGPLTNQVLKKLEAPTPTTISSIGKW